MTKLNLNHPLAKTLALVAAAGTAIPAAIKADNQSLAAEQQAKETAHSVAMLDLLGESVSGTAKKTDAPITASGIPLYQGLFDSRDGLAGQVVAMNRMLSIQSGMDAALKAQGDAIQKAAERRNNKEEFFGVAGNGGTGHEINTAEKYVEIGVENSYGDPLYTKILMISSAEGVGDGRTESVSLTASGVFRRCNYKGIQDSIANSLGYEIMSSNQNGYADTDENRAGFCGPGDGPVNNYAVNKTIAFSYPVNSWNP